VIEPWVFVEILAFSSTHRVQPSSNTITRFLIYSHFTCVALQVYRFLIYSVAHLRPAWVRAITAFSSTPFLGSILAPAHHCFLYSDFVHVYIDFIYIVLNFQPSSTCTCHDGCLDMFFFLLLACVGFVDPSCVFEVLAYMFLITIIASSISRIKLILDHVNFVTTTVPGSCATPLICLFLVAKFVDHFKKHMTRVWCHV
jgi:hypothetical protein